MDRSSGRGRRLLLALALSFGLVAGMAGQATARQGLPLICQTSGIVTQTGGPGTWNWNIQIAFGQCFGDQGGPYAMQGSGSGTSTGLGLCDGLLVRSLRLAVHLNLISALGPAFDKSFDEVWSAPLTTYPLATPFLVSAPSGGLVGLGVILSHVHFACPPKGTPGAVTIELRLSPN
jgi:hypothetical protein